MASADAELALAHRYYALASNPYDRPLVARRNTVPTLITLMVSAYPAVRRIAAETIYLLCDHPQNPEFLLTTNLLNALNAEISIQASASQSDCGSTSPMDAESEDERLVEVLENETMTFLEMSRDLLEHFAQLQQNEIMLSDDGSSSPQARPAFSSSTARPMLRRAGQRDSSRGGDDEVSQRRQANRQTVSRGSSSWLKSSWRWTRGYLFDMAVAAWQWASKLCLFLMNLSVRRSEKSPGGVSS